MITASDQEASLQKSLIHNFSKDGKSPLISYCTIHLKDNLIRHLRKQNIPRKVQHKIYKAIWVGDNSILHSPNEFDYIERRIAFESDFIDYLQLDYMEKYLDKLHDHVILVHKETDGRIPLEITNNDSGTYIVAIKHDKGKYVFYLSTTVSEF